MSKFIDYVTIHITAGNGGSGSVSFRREKFIPRGGPNGGDGGNGGSVIFEADHNLGTLLDFRYNRHHAAEAGEGGGSNNKSGKGGEDLVLRVPVGTIIFDDDTDELIHDMATPGERIVMAQGGSGGWGNTHFKSSTNRSPRRANSGTEGESFSLRMELKLLADVGLVGYPNAGKSTLISRISAAKPKIADYPFTTLAPNLGVVKWADYKTYVVADVPGLIEGAAEGKGLGLRFLKHLERTRLILHLIDPVVDEEGRNPLHDYKAIRRELEKFSSELAAKPEMIVITKTDSISAEQRKVIEEELSALPEVTYISAVTGAGLEGLTKKVGSILETMRHEEMAIDDESVYPD